jgi:hypothetical protein
VLSEAIRAVSQARERTVGHVRVLDDSTRFLGEEKEQLRK